jgi:hypothetical protein
MLSKLKENYKKLIIALLVLILVYYLFLKNKVEMFSDNARIIALPDKNYQYAPIDMKTLNRIIYLWAPLDRSKLDFPTLKRGEVYNNLSFGSNVANDYNPDTKISLFFTNSDADDFITEMARMGYTGATIEDKDLALAFGKFKEISVNGEFTTPDQLNYVEPAKDVNMIDSVYLKFANDVGQKSNIWNYTAEGVYRLSLYVYKPNDNTGNKVELVTISYFKLDKGHSAALVLLNKPFKIQNDQILILAIRKKGQALVKLEEILFNMKHNFEDARKGLIYKELGVKI